MIARLWQAILRLLAPLFKAKVEPLLIFTCPPVIELAPVAKSSDELSRVKVPSVWLNVFVAFVTSDALSFKVKLPPPSATIPFQLSKLSITALPFVSFNVEPDNIDNTVPDAIESLNKKMESIVTKKFKDSKLECVKLITKLDALSPLKTLTRGYSIAECEGKIVNSSKILKNNDIVTLRFKDGTNKAQIIE